MHLGPSGNWEYISFEFVYSANNWGKYVNRIHKVGFVVEGFFCPLVVTFCNFDGFKAHYCISALLSIGCQVQT